MRQLEERARQMEALKGPKLILLVFEDKERETWGKQSTQPLEVGKGKEIDYSLEPPESNATHQHLDLSLVRSVLVCWSIER